MNRDIEQFERVWTSFDDSTVPPEEYVKWMGEVGVKYLTAQMLLMQRDIKGKNPDDTLQQVILSLGTACGIQFGQGVVTGVLYCRDFGIPTELVRGYGPTPGANPL